MTWWTQLRPSRRYLVLRAVVAYSNTLILNSLPVSHKLTLVLSLWGVVSVPSTKEMGFPDSPKPCCKVVKYTTCAYKTMNCIDDTYQYVLCRLFGLNVTMIDHLTS
ncbi:hypothetical protein C8R48DRAFT_739331 [Suillus tomentosus]|nr:hypothetical protein C8R48DRAFT_739331 [Suillus tomentosus]